MSASRPWRVYVLNYGRDYMWGTYETKERADEIAQGLRDRGENASVRAFQACEGCALPVRQGTAMSWGWILGIAACAVVFMWLTGDGDDV